MVRRFLGHILVPFLLFGALCTCRGKEGDAPSEALSSFRLPPPIELALQSGQIKTLALPAEVRNLNDLHLEKTQLEVLFVRDSVIASIEALPRSLKVLDLGGSKNLTNAPLGSALVCLDISGTQIVSLGLSRRSLRHLGIGVSSGQASIRENLPSQLRGLYLSAGVQDELNSYFLHGTPKTLLAVGLDGVPFDSVAGLGGQLESLWLENTSVTELGSLAASKVRKLSIVSNSSDTVSLATLYYLIDLTYVVQEQRGARPQLPVIYDPGQLRRLSSRAQISSELIVSYDLSALKSLDVLESMKYFRTSPLIELESLSLTGSLEEVCSTAAKSSGAILDLIITGSRGSNDVTLENCSLNVLKRTQTLVFGAGVYLEAQDFMMMEALEFLSLNQVMLGEFPTLPSRLNTLDLRGARITSGSIRLPQNLRNVIIDRDNLFYIGKFPAAITGVFILDGDSRIDTVLLEGCSQYEEISILGSEK